MTPELLSPPHVTSSQTHLMQIYEKQDTPSIEYIKTRTSAPLLRNSSTIRLRGADSECVWGLRVPIFVLLLTLWLLFWLEAVHFLQSIITRYLIISTKNGDGGIFFPLRLRLKLRRRWVNKDRKYGQNILDIGAAILHWWCHLKPDTGDSIFEFPPTKLAHLAWPSYFTSIQKISPRLLKPD